MSACLLDLTPRPGLELFSGAQRAMKVVRHCTDFANGLHFTETVYAMTSLGHR